MPLRLTPTHGLASLAYSGVHHGYFIPGANPDSAGASFPGMGYDGPADVALALSRFLTRKVIGAIARLQQPIPNVKRLLLLCARPVVSLVTSVFS